MSYVKSNKVKLYYEETGEGYPIIFVHEFGSDLREWEQQVRYFSREYKCITFNARGYPPSQVPKDIKQYGYKHSVDDIANLMNKLKINNAHIIGLSMGAYAALLFGVKYKKMVKSLVIAGVGSGAMPQHRKSFYSMANELADTFIKKGSKRAANIISNSGSRVQLKNKDPRGWAEFKKHLEEHSNLGSALTMQQYQALRPSLMDFEKELKRMNVPVLLAVGDEDELCLDINIYLKRHIKTSGLWICPRTGHAINLEEPLDFNKEVQSFFSTVERGNWRKRDKESIKDIN
jgi:pimeloyl-ACP methyl ester carboxylesterase